MAARKRRTLLVLLFVLVVLGAALVGFAPAIISHTIGPGLVRDAIAGRVQGTADVAALRISWAGPQEVRGLRVIEPDGREAVRADVVVDGSLLGLAGTIPYVVRLSGALAGTVRADGSTSFGDLPVPAPEPAAPKTGEPFDLAGVPAFTVHVDGIDVVLDLPEDAGASTLDVTGLTGCAVYAPGGTLGVTLDGTTSSGGLDGTIHVALNANGLIDAAGAFRPSGTVLDGDIRLTSLPVPFDARIEQVELLTLDLDCADLASSPLTAVIVANTLVTGEPPSTLDGTLTLAPPFTPDGTLRVGPETVRGTITGTRVPTALLQPFVAGTGVELRRDLGPSFETLGVTFAPDADSGTDVTVSVATAHAELDLAAAVGADGAVDASRLDANAMLQPALASALLGVTIDVPAPITVTTRRFALPARGDGAFDPSTLALDATVAFEGAMSVTTSALPRPVGLGASTLNVAGAPLGAGVTVSGLLAVEGGTIEIDERLGVPFGADGSVDVAGVTADGRVTIAGVSTALVRALLADAVDPAQLDAVLAATVDGTLTTSTGDAGPRAVLTLTTGTTSVTGAAVRTADAIRVDAATVAVTASPALVASLQADAASPVTVTGPVEITLALDEPITLSAPTLGAITMPADPVRGTINVTGAVVEHAALAEALAIEVLPTTVALTLTAPRRLDVVLAARTRRAATATEVVRLDGTIGVDLDAETPAPAGVLEVDVRSVAGVEAMLGLDAGAIGDWTGAAGLVTVDVAQVGAARTATLTSALPGLAGTIVAEQSAEALTLRDGALTLSLSKAQLERLLLADDAPPAPRGVRLPGMGAAPPSRRFAISKDATFTATIPSVALPMAALSGDPVAPESITVDARLAGGPITITENDLVVAALDNLVVTIAATGLATPLRVDVTGAARGPAGTTPGTVDVKATVDGLLDAESRLAPRNAGVSFVANVEHVPTLVVDRMLGWAGTLVAAFGADVSLTGTADRFSPRGGTLDMRLDTAAGTFLTGRLLGGDDAIRTTTETPLHGELAFRKELRDQVLKKVHPIFGDIRTTEERRITFNVPESALLPVDGDLGRLNADVEIVVGDVEIDRGSGILALLKLAGDSRSRTTLPGRIDPIKAKIRNGLLTYDRFDLVLDDFTLRYSGTVNLVTREIALRTEVPISSLSGDMSRYQSLGNIAVPLVTRGTIDVNRTEADLSGLVENIDIGGIIGDLLKRKK